MVPQVGRRLGSALQALEPPEAPAGAGRCHGGLAGLWGSWKEPDTEMPRRRSLDTSPGLSFSEVHFPCILQCSLLEHLKPHRANGPNLTRQQIRFDGHIVFAFLQNDLHYYQFPISCKLQSGIASS